MGVEMEFVVIQRQKERDGGIDGGGEGETTLFIARVVIPEGPMCARERGFAWFELGRERV